MSSSVETHEDPNQGKKRDREDKKKRREDEKKRKEEEEKEKKRRLTQLYNNGCSKPTLKEVKNKFQKIQTEPFNVHVI